MIIVKKIKILFYVEHVDREISTVKSIIEQLELSENDYIIVSTNFAMGISKFLYRPELVVTPWLYSDFCYKKIVSFFLLNKVKVLNLHHEQITNLDRLEALLPSGLSKNVFHLSWGQFFKEKMVSRGVAENDIFVTGSIRLAPKKASYSKEELANKYFGDSNAINKKWIMFVSSYSWKDLPDSVIHKVERNGRKNVWEYKSIVKQSYQKTLSWIEDFLVKNPEVLYAYRLHPSENVDEQLLRLVNTYENFHIINELTISEWINHFDILDLWISTSIAEIFVYEKPVRIIRPITLPSNVEVEGFQNFDKTCSIEDFTTVDFESTPYNFNNSKEYLKIYYSYGIDSGKTTSLAVTDILGKSANKINISKVSMFAFATKELLKDVVKILLVKTNLIKYTSFDRLKKSFFVISKIDEFK